MKREELDRLEDGVYRIYWISSGSSVGVISTDRTGNKRLQCSNWCSEIDLLSQSAEGIERVELISNQKGDKGELATAWEMIKSLREDGTKYEIELPEMSDQSPSKTLMELAFEEEAELIRAATALLTFNHGQATLIRPALEAASEYLASKFKEASNVESD